MNWGMRVLQTLALPLGYVTVWKKEQAIAPFSFGAGDEARTRYLHLGKVALYQMSYAREYAQHPLRGGASGRNRTNDTRIFSPLLYQLSYRGVSSRDCSLIMATTKGLEPSTSGVTGRRSNQLNYMATFWWEQQGSNL